MLGMFALGASLRSAAESWPGVLWEGEKADCVLGVRSYLWGLVGRFDPDTTYIGFAFSGSMRALRLKVSLLFDLDECPLILNKGSLLDKALWIEMEVPS